ncbi:hypothetical protein BTO30_14150 [Domibacillus antri]|uniref:Uncharacterized protein n=1 Tax=Domibacillus antri TaxID=1714264 RepID=A0A1Q8Q2N9_9BACI|nr:hypothetical protein [Domibacillus antri]OLN21619.1 hypothetical protein BTO30_14150 [Domibacillus antri]
MDSNQTNKINRVSLKAMTIHSLQIMIDQFKELSPNNDFQILLLTPFGFIAGDLEALASTEEMLSPNENSNFNFDVSAVVTTRNEFVNKMKDENPAVEVIDNGAALNFKNVRVFKDQLCEPILNMNQMLVFADQIISFSIVPRDFDQQEL